MTDQIGKAPPGHSEPFIIGAHHGIAAPQPGVELGHHVADGPAGRNPGCRAASGHARRPRRPADHRPATARRPATRNRDRSRNCYRAPVQGCRAIKHQPRPGASSQPHVARRGPNPDRGSVHPRQRHRRPVERHPCWSRPHTVSRALPPPQAADTPANPNPTTAVDQTTTILRTRIPPSLLQRPPTPPEPRSQRIGRTSCRHWTEDDRHNAA